ncbi:ERF family protein, partial [Escherichia coli]|nr:recombinase [Escherichia coli]EHY9596661.1 ERF family protein [Escherichia coli]EJR4335475.1 ERF family protein [Escherichia coli]EJV3103045.1 ERF family protein [Escherichia coli]ELV1337358.1 ERF family protein [Escherichia coli]
MSKDFYARLAAIQENLNAPKNQYNSFGKYKYRSCEDILEGVKPLLNGLFLSISDEV